MARDYSTLPSKIIGRGVYGYSKDKICQILTHYNKRNFKSWNKTKLLQQLVEVERTLSRQDERYVQLWMTYNQYGVSAPRFSEFVRTRKLPEITDSVSDDEEFLSPGPFGRSATIDCVVCMESLEPESFPKHKITPSCDHKTTTCTSCLTQAIESQIPDVAWDQIKCPECPEMLDFASVKQVVSPEAFERFDRKSVMATFEHMPNFTMCLGPGCDSGQIHGGGDDQPIMTCTTCKFKTCFTHKLPHHAGMTCDEYDEDASRKRRIEEEAASEKHLREETKKCPNSDCAVPCVKVIGCDHITCHRCKHQWCYICFAPYTEIWRVGNSAHDPTCKYHPDNLPSARESDSESDGEEVVADDDDWL